MWTYRFLQIAFGTLGCLLGVSFTVASPFHVRSTYVVKDDHPVPPGWEIIERAPREEQIHLQIGLKHGRFDELERHLYEGLAHSLLCLLPFAVSLTL